MTQLWFPSAPALHCQGLGHHLRSLRLPRCRRRSLRLSRGAFGGVYIPLNKFPVNPGYWKFHHYIYICMYVCIIPLWNRMVFLGALGLKKWKIVNWRSLDRRNVEDMLVSCDSWVYEWNAGTYTQEDIPMEELHYILSYTQEDIPMIYRMEVLHHGGYWVDTSWIEHHVFQCFFFQYSCKESQKIPSQWLF